MKQRYLDLLRVQVGERKTVDKYMLDVDRQKDQTPLFPHT